MKKIVFSLLILTFISTQLLAQSDGDWDQRPFRFGIQLSPSWAWMGTSDKNIEGAGANWGGKLQVMGEKKINANSDAPSNYYLTTGLGFSFNQGGFLQNNYKMASFWRKSELSEAGLDTVAQNTKLHYRLTYIEVPFGLKMIGGTGTDSKLRFYAEAPIITLGFMTSKAKGDIIGNTRPGSPGSSEDEIIRDDVKALSLSWGLGAGVEYELSPTTRLVTGLNFQRQFTDVTGNGRVETTSGEWKDDKSKATISMLTWRIGVFF